MLLGWFDSSHATKVGVTLADQFATDSGPLPAARSHQKTGLDPVKSLLKRAELQARSLTLNFYKKAKLANAFKWRLLERGVEPAVAADVTQALVMHLSMSRVTSVPVGLSPSGAADLKSLPGLFAKAERHVAEEAYEQAAALYRQVLERDPRNADGLNNLGAVLGRLGRFREAEPYLRQALASNPRAANANTNLGSMLRPMGRLVESEKYLRTGVRLAPNDVEARFSLAHTLMSLVRLDEARQHLERVLKLNPRHEGAQLAMGELTALDGRFQEAAALYLEVLKQHPNSSGALVGLMALRKQTTADAALAKRAEGLLAGKLASLDQINLHYALGKYYDDIGAYAEAFKNYQHANDIVKANADPYDAASHERFVDDLIRVCSSATCAPTSGSSPSMKPVLVVGMPRSGTSLVEQIIASHPAAHGAGELDFWTVAAHKHEAELRQGTFSDEVKGQLAQRYLALLERKSKDAQRVIDKAPVNADYLGLIHAVFPQARIIYMQRHPIDTCLSCYFQQFSAALNYTMDLRDLAHYYQQHRRLLAHWHSVLPPGAILNVPYEQLVDEQELWTRRILEFIDLEWDERCLNFHETRRTVATASLWQVRQKMFKRPVQRWHHYRKFIKPLLGLEAVDG